MGSKKMNNMRLPAEIMRIIGDAESERITLGMSGAIVYRYASSGLFLKIEPHGGEVVREKDALLWLEDKLPVPHVAAFASDDKYYYLLTHTARGDVLCGDYYMKNPRETVYALADGLRLLRAVNTEECPFSGKLDVKLHDAKSLVDAGLVDTADWEDETDFTSAQSLLNWLEKNLPPEKLVFCHGDYCFENIFGTRRAATGFIDLGRCGVADEWQDISLALRSLWHNFETREFDELLLSEIGVPMDAQKLKYYILLDELF